MYIAPLSDAYFALCFVSAVQSVALDALEMWNVQQRGSEFSLKRICEVLAPVSRPPVICCWTGFRFDWQIWYTEVRGLYANYVPVVLFIERCKNSLELQDCPILSSWNSSATWKCTKMCMWNSTRIRIDLARVLAVIQDRKSVGDSIWYLIFWAWEFHAHPYIQKNHIEALWALWEENEIYSCRWRRVAFKEGELYPLHHISAIMGLWHVILNYRISSGKQAKQRCFLNRFRIGSKEMIGYAKSQVLRKWSCTTLSSICYLCTFQQLSDILNWDAEILLISSD